MTGQTLIASTLFANTLFASTLGKIRWAIVRLTAAAILGGVSIAVNVNVNVNVTPGQNGDTAPGRKGEFEPWRLTFTLIRPAQAVPVRSNLSLEAYPNEGYQNFVQRAEAMAQTEIDARFSRDITISRISLVAMGRNGGLTAQLLSIDLDRTDWHRNPDITQYARYSPDSRTLLGLPLNGTNFAPPTLGTGDVQVTLRWTGRDDLDLAVSEPGGEIIFFGNPQLPSGAALDVDANALCEVVTPVPIENVFWPTTTAATGNYQAVVSLFTRCDARSTSPIPFTLTISVAGTPQIYSGEVSETESYRSYRFDVGTN